MDCQRAREGLWPPERPRLVGDEVAEARAHVEACPECAEYFDQDRVLLELYDRARGESAPIEVREKVFDALARARWDFKSEGAAKAPAGEAPAGEAPVRGRAWLRIAVWPLAVAASIAVVIVAELAPGRAVEGDDPAMFVEDYLRRAVSQDQIVTSDAAEVRRFLERELGMELQPIQLAGLNLERVEICLLDGRRGAMIVYELDGAVVSHYLVPREGAEARPPALSDHRGADAMGRMPVVTWSTPRVEQALVGEVDSTALLRLAALGASQP